MSENESLGLMLIRRERTRRTLNWNAMVALRSDLDEHSGKEGAVQFRSSRAMSDQALASSMQLLVRVICKFLADMSSLKR